MSDLNLDLALSFLLCEEHPGCSSCIFGGIFISRSSRLTVLNYFGRKVDCFFPPKVLGASWRYFLPNFISYSSLNLIIFLSIACRKSRGSYSTKSVTLSWRFFRSIPNRLSLSVHLPDLIFLHLPHFISQQIVFARQFYPSFISQIHIHLFIHFHAKDLSKREFAKFCQRLTGKLDSQNSRRAEEIWEISMIVWGFFFIYIISSLV